MQADERLRDVMKRPSAYGVRTWDGACLFLLGFDTALEFRPLDGFGYWLANALDGGWNLTWPTLAADLVSRRLRESGQIVADLEPEGQLNALFDLIREFLDNRDSS